MDIFSLTYCYFTKKRTLQSCLSVVFGQNKATNPDPTIGRKTWLAMHFLDLAAKMKTQNYCNVVFKAIIWLSYQKKALQKSIS